MRAMGFSEEGQKEMGTGEPKGDLGRVSGNAPFLGHRISVP